MNNKEKARKKAIDTSCTENTYGGKEGKKGYEEGNQHIETAGGDSALKLKKKKGGERNIGKKKREPIGLRSSLEEKLRQGVTGGE